MKQKLQNMLSLFLLGTMCAKAQPVLTAANTNPVIGDKFTIQAAYANSFSDPTNGGANTVWDYTKLVDSAASFNITVVSPTGLPGATNFPTATVAWYNSSQSFYGFYKATSSSFGQVGQYLSANNWSSFSPQITKVVYPASYNKFSTDSFTYYDPTLPAGFNCVVYDTIKVDGYGTLKLPKKTYFNVAREKATTTFVFTYNGFEISRVSETFYEFAVSGIHYPILELVSTSEQSGSWSANYYSSSIDTVPVLTPIGPIITANGFNPQIGDAFKLQDTKLFHTTQEFSGENKVWDFTSLIDSGSAIVLSIVSPKTLPYSDSFPTANIGYKWSNSYGYNGIEFDKVSNTSWGEVGFYQSATSNGGYSYFIRISPSFPVMVYPMSMNTTYTDTVQYYYRDSSSTNVYENTYTLNDTLIGLGYGQLKLPSGNFDSVVCVYRNGSYWFVANKIHNPLLVLNQAFDNTNGNTLTGWWNAEYYNGKPLPLQITSFTAALQNKQPVLQWSATNTENTAAFNVQRSTDGNSFTSIAIVAANKGTQYHFEDSYTPTNTVYYRLQQEDKTGKYFYSNIAKLTINSNLLSVSPNPVKDIATVRGEHIASIQVFDNLGRILKTQTVQDANNPTISLSSLPIGSYHFRVQTTDGKVSTVGFQKQ